MAHNYFYRQCCKAFLLVSMLCWSVGPALAQFNTPFEIRWSLSNTKAGVSQLLDQTVPFPYFTPALLRVEGVNDAGYKDGKAIVVNRWNANTDYNKEFVEVSFVPISNGIEYNITSIVIILSKNDNSGVNGVDTRLARDGFTVSATSTTPINIYPATTTITFNPNIINRSVPTGLRIYGYNRANAQSELIIDEIIFRGTTTNFILPVNLTYFNAQAVDSRVELGWETAWERNSREFVVQRSRDLKEFGDIGRIAAAGTTDGRRQYTFTDQTPLPGANYYRLRMVDIDGSYEFSKVQDVVVHAGNPTLLVSSNPTTGERIRLRTSGVEASQLSLTTMMGQNIPFRLHQENGEYTDLVPASKLAPGMYFLSVDREGVRSHTKVLVY